MSVGSLKASQVHFIVPCLLWLLFQFIFMNVKDSVILSISPHHECHFKQNFGGKLLILKLNSEKWLYTIYYCIYNILYDFNYYF